MTDRRRMHVIFRKDAGARYLSHLDLMATIEFSIRRARLPIELSEGFNPRPRMSLVAPLVLGHVGEREILEMTLREPTDTQEVQERLQAAVPPGITILEVTEVPVNAKPAASRIRSVTYRVSLQNGLPDLPQRIESLLLREMIEIEEDREGKVRRRDIRPLIVTMEAASEAAVRMTVRMTGEGTVRPEHILDLLDIPREGASFAREKIDLD